MKQHIYQTLAKKRYYLSIKRNHRNGYFYEFNISEESNKIYGCNLKDMSFEDLFEKIKYYADTESIGQIESINYEIEPNNYELIHTIEQDFSLQKSEFVWIDNNKYRINSTKENEDGSLNVYINKIRFTEEIGLKECGDFKAKVEAMKYINSHKEEDEKSLGDLESCVNKDWEIEDEKPDIDDDIKNIDKNKFMESVKRIFK